VQAQREPRGQWLDQDGTALSHEQVLNWVAAEGKAQRFTHQFILSVKHAQLAEAAYSRVLAEGNPYFKEWRLLVHSDTRYPHAHAVTFGEREIRIKSAQFQSWALAVRQELEREQQAVLQQQLEAEAQLGLEQQQQQVAEELALEAPQTPQTSRQQESELDLEWEVGL
jgi:hypothetical protein